MKLKKVINKNFPFPRYTALTFYPWVFIREDLKEDYNSKVERHETTHMGFGDLGNREYIRRH